MHHDLCGGLPTLCDAMKPTKGADLLKYLRKVQFEGKNYFYLSLYFKKVINENFQFIFFNHFSFQYFFF